MKTAVSSSGSSQTVPLPFPVDVSHVLFDINKTFNPLHNECLLDYQVSGLNNGYVLFTIAMPEGMSRVFAMLLESLGGFFRVLDRKSKAASAEKKAFERSMSVNEHERRSKLQNEFRDSVLALYDGFIASGLDAKHALRRTNLTLKQENHPWATYDAVQKVIRGSGRFRTVRGFKK